MRLLKYLCIGMVDSMITFKQSSSTSSSKNMMLTTFGARLVALTPATTMMNFARTISRARWWLCRVAPVRARPRIDRMGDRMSYWEWYGRLTLSHSKRVWNSSPVSSLKMWLVLGSRLGCLFGLDRHRTYTTPHKLP